MYSSDQNGGLVETENGFSQSQSHILPNCNNNNNNNRTNPNFSMEDPSNCTNNNPQIPPLSQQEDHHQVAAAATALEMELQRQLNLDMDQHCNNNGNNNEIQTQVLVNEYGAVVSTWQEMAANFQLGVDHQYHPQNDPSSLPPDHTSTPTHDLLNIFPFPRCPSSSSSSSIKPNSSLLASLGLLGDLNPPDGSSSTTTNIVYDPPLLIPPLMNLPPQPPALLRDLFHSLPPHGINGVGVGGYNTSTTTPSRNNSNNTTTSSLFGVGMDEMMRDNNISIGLNGGLYPNQNGIFENGVFEFTAGEMDCLAAAAAKKGKDTKHFTTERHRRVLLNGKYEALRKLIPSPGKNDRATTVGDAINYINELKRTVGELKVLVEKKRCAKERLKRPKSENESSSILLMEGQGNEFSNNSDMSPYNNLNNNGSALRCSWLHRKSKNTEVDVRIIDDEVTVKLVQQKRINCLLFVSKVLDDFQLDLHHVAGGLIGDYYSFLFNSKICEGSIVYASAVANKLVEVVDKQYSSILPTSSY